MLISEVCRKPGIAEHTDKLPQEEQIRLEPVSVADGAGYVQPESFAIYVNNSSKG